MSRIVDDGAAIREAKAALAAQGQMYACLCCGATEGVRMECSDTAYPFDGERGSPDDPNKDIPLCSPCAEEHHAYWREMWEEYYAGRL